MTNDLPSCSTSSGPSLMVVPAKEPCCAREGACLTWPAHGWESPERYAALTAAGGMPSTRPQIESPGGTRRRRVGRTLSEPTRPPSRESTRLLDSAGWHRSDSGGRGWSGRSAAGGAGPESVSYTHLRAHETPEHLVCRLLLEKKKNQTTY